MNIRDSGSGVSSSQTDDWDVKYFEKHEDDDESDTEEFEREGKHFYYQDKV